MIDRQRHRETSDRKEVATNRPSCEHDVNGRARQVKQSEQEGSGDNRRRIDIRPQTTLPLLRASDARSARSFSLPLPIDEQSIDIHARTRSRPTD